MNKDKTIKDLKERNNKLENQRRQFEIWFYCEQNKCKQKDKEIKRLNNIINELEKFMKSDDGWDVENIIDKLQELKESDKG